MGSVGLAVLHMKGGLVGTSFTTYVNWPPLGRAVLPAPARPQSIRIENLDKGVIPGGNRHRVQQQAGVSIDPEPFSLCLANGIVNHVRDGKAEPQGCHQPPQCSASALLSCSLLGLQQWLRAQGCSVKAGSCSSWVFKARKFWAKRSEGKVQALGSWGLGEGLPSEYV